MNENDYSYTANDFNVNNRKKTVSIPTLIITIITTIVLVVIVVSNWSNVLEMVGFEVDHDEVVLDDEFSV
jgi:hypothetical protein